MVLGILTTQDTKTYPGGAIVNKQKTPFPWSLWVPNSKNILIKLVTI